MVAPTDRDRSSHSAEAVRRPHVLVLGGGIAGLTAARQVLLEHPVWRVTVLESAAQVGGKLRREEVAGTLVDTGAESLLFRRPEAAALARAVGLGEDLEHPATYAARVWSLGRRRPLPRSVMGVPGDPASLEESGLLSPAGLARALDEPTLGPTDEQQRVIAGEDVSVGDLVASRFGDEVVDRLVEPLLGGVYAGDARRLSVAACTPQILALARDGGSMLEAAGASLAAPASSTPVFVGVRGGVGRLAESVAHDVEARGGDVRTGVTARRLTRTADGFAVETGPVPAPSTVAADAVVLAVPAAPAARLLQDLAPAAAAELGGVAYASSAVITLAFDTRALPDLDGSGFLVPPSEGRLVKASTFSAAKWGWLREAGEAEESGAGVPLTLLRLSVGRIGEEQRLQVDDARLVVDATADLAEALAVTLPDPVDSRVTRWGGGLPQYAPGHLGLVSRVREAVAAVPGLAVCGAAYDGVGVPACIASGEQAATEAAAGIEGARGGPAQWRA